MDRQKCSDGIAKDLYGKLPWPDEHVVDHSARSRKPLVLNFP